MKNDETRASRADVLGQLQSIINSQTNDPAAECQAMGRALLEVGKALEGLSVSDARNTIEAVVALQGFKSPRF